VALEEQAQVLVTVKAYPNPSQSYGETVCVAGVRLDTPTPEWIRLYPVPYRDMAYQDRFRKYQVLDLKVSKAAAKDGRPESYRPNRESIKLGPVVPSNGHWRDRWAYLESLVGATTACELNRAQKTPGAASLGLVKVDRVVDLIIEPNDEFSADQRAAAEAAAAEDLFGNQRSALEPAPLRLKYKYFCAEAGCRSHTQTNIDWEAGESVRKWAAQTSGPEQLQDWLRRKWLDQVCGPNRDTYFFLGNQAKRRHVFAVLGVFWPPVGTRPEPKLF
jgi:hypothetical protein